MQVERAAGQPRGDGASWILRHRSVLAVLGIIAVAAVVLDRQRAPVSFWYDEWAFIQYRRGWDLDGFGTPHIGHFIAVPALLYRLGFELFGLTHYRPFRWMGIASHLMVATAVWWYLRARTSELVALASMAAIALLGSGWQNIYFPFTVNLTVALASGVLSWALLHSATRRGDIGASVLHAVAVASSGIGIAVAVGSAAQLVAQRQWRRAMLVVGPSAVLWTTWAALYDPATKGSWANLGNSPRYVVDMVAGGAGGLFGRDLLWGRVLLGALVAVAVMRRHQLFAAIAPAVCLVVNAVLTATARAEFGDPTASRYAYTNAVLILLVLAPLAPATMSLGRRSWAWVVAAVLVASVWGNAAVLRRGALGLRIDSGIATAELRAMEWAEDLVDDDFMPDLRRMPVVVAGEYFDAVADLGSPTVGLPPTEQLDPFTQSLVDGVSLAAMGVTARRTADTCLSATIATMQRDVAAGGRVVVTAGEAPVEVRLRRYATTDPTQPTAVVAAGSTAVVEIPVDRAPRQTWVVTATSAAGFSAC